MLKIVRMYLLCKVPLSCYFKGREKTFKKTAKILHFAETNFCGSLGKPLADLNPCCHLWRSANYKGSHKTLC